MNQTLQFLLLAEEQKGPQGMGQFLQWVPIVAVLFFGYFLFMRPAMADRRRQMETLNSLKKNDRVVTVGGIIGTIADMNDDRVTLRVDDGTRIKFRRSAIQGPYEENKDQQK